MTPNIKNLIGLSEIEYAFKNIPGVEPSLLVKDWIRNHYKWIIWKLASYERMFPNYLKGSLTVENVIQQLKYRFVPTYVCNLKSFIMLKQLSNNCPRFNALMYFIEMTLTKLFVLNDYQFYLCDGKVCLEFNTALMRRCESMR